MNRTLLKLTTAIPGVACVICVLSASACQAALIASDSFATSGVGAYLPNVTLNGQNPTLGTPGFVGAWGNPGTSGFLPVNGGLTHPLTPGEIFDGRLIGFSSVGSVGGGNARNLSREIAYTPVDGTYYMSVLLNKNNSTSGRDLLAGLGSSQSATASIFGLDGAYIGFVDSGINVFVGPGPSVFTQLLSPGAMNVGETYFALLEFNYSTSALDTMTATIYDGSSSVVVSQPFTGVNLDGKLGRFKVFYQDFGPSTAVDEWRFGTELSDVMVTGPACDFNGDDECNIIDINSLLAVGPVASGVPAAGMNQFDLTGDGVINNDDVDEWLAIAATENGLGSPYKRGDATLEGIVDGEDFIRWNASKFTPTLAWNEGDFNGDGVNDGQDFVLWNLNKFTSSDGVSVPEPSLTLYLFGLLVLLGWRRQ